MSAQSMQELSINSFLQAILDPIEAIRAAFINLPLAVVVQAILARLILTADELSRYQSQIHAILDFISKLQMIPLDDVEPTTQVAGLLNV